MFDSWVESFSVANAYADLWEFIVFDQFLSSLSPELPIYQGKEACQDEGSNATSG